MTSTQSSGQVLKVDSLTRVRTSVERRQLLLEEFDKSGLSGSKFAALVGVKYSTFAAWAARRKRAQPATATPAKLVDDADKVRWMEAVLDQAQGANGKESPGLILHFGGGARAEITQAWQAELAAALLWALAKTSASPVESSC